MGLKTKILPRATRFGLWSQEWASYTGLTVTLKDNQQISLLFEYALKISLTTPTL